MKYMIVVTLKSTISDPAGKSTEAALKRMGYGVKNVRVGKVIHVECESLEEVEKMCPVLLANTIIEDYEVISQ